jgi:hypothetical protein
MFKPTPNTVNRNFRIGTLAEIAHRLDVFRLPWIGFDLAAEAADLAVDATIERVGDRAAG